jgi:phosphoglycolate phosphatase
MRRLVLFDIDGTLLTAGGSGKRAIHDAMMQVYGTVGRADEGYSFGGRTDPQIVTELLMGDGWQPDAVEAGFPVLWDAYVANLRRELQTSTVMTLPGVPAVLDAVEACGEDVLLGLLTGNVAEGARLKVDAAGLGFSRFVVGAYGSDHGSRPELPAIAARRALERTGEDYRGKEIVIIGETPFDVSCGAHLGVRTIAVTTGGYPAHELEACGPDHLFTDLSDTDAVLRAILD